MAFLLSLLQKLKICIQWKLIKIKTHHPPPSYMTKQSSSIASTKTSMKNHIERIFDVKLTSHQINNKKPHWSSTPWPLIEINYNLLFLLNQKVRKPPSVKNQSPKAQHSSQQTVRRLVWIKQVKRATKIVYGNHVLSTLSLPTIQLEIGKAYFEYLN